MGRNKWIITGIFFSLAIAAHLRYSKSDSLRTGQSMAKRDPVKDREAYLNEMAMRKAAREREKIMAERAQAQATPAQPVETMQANSPALQNLARELVVAQEPKPDVAVVQKKQTEDVEDETRRYYVTRLGDTLFNVAEKELGDRRRWLQIAHLNGKAGRPGAALPAGTRLKMPNANDSFEPSDPGVPPVPDVGAPMNLPTGFPSEAGVAE